MMYKRTDLTLSMFYASSVDAEGNKVATLSTNDIRRMENLPPIAGGDKYLTPLNMVDSAKILPGDKSPTAKQLAEIETLLARA